MPEPLNFQRQWLRITGVLLLVLGGLPRAEADDDALFPFLISYDAPDNVTNVSSWLHRPAGKHGFVRTQGGRLVADDEPIRFWATNLCFDACFPQQQQAERVAARLARFGINCVRMHHMDSRSIWGKSPDKLTIDPKQLERLDYLVWALKQRGIYTNINLHVSRWLGDAEGFPARDGRPKYDKGLGNFEPRMIELQKKYARDLLTHVNPHTGTSYAQEPAVAFVEISNEDALFCEWSRRHLDDLAEPYATTFREKFNAWLRKKYGTTDRLARAWNAAARAPGDELLANGDFAGPLDGSWHLQRDEAVDADWATQPEGPEGGRCLTITVRRQGEAAWIPQVFSAPFAVKKDERYTVTFAVRCDRAATLSANCVMAHAPWKSLGLYASVKGTTEWKRHQTTFVARQSDDKARITFTGLKPGTYRLAAVSIRPAGLEGLLPGQRLENNSVPILKRQGIDCTDARRDDFLDFLWDTERDYWLGMYTFLKDDLHVRSLVSGTQLSYGPVHVQAELDYIDAHSYWKHPSFPGRPWDRRDWYVRNVAMVNDPPGTLGSLAGRRVAGMAYTVSEYNHPTPNQYAAEGFPMIATFGAFQRWDGIFSFAYCHNDRFEPDRLSSYFDIKGDPGRLVHMPACAALFLRGDVAPAKRLLTAPAGPQSARKRLQDTLDPWQINAVDMGIARHQVLRHAVAMDLDPTGKTVAAENPSANSAATYVSDTGQIRWDVSKPGAGYFVADTPRTKLLTGFIRGRQFDLGSGVQLAVGKTILDWATVTLTVVEGKGFDGPGRILVAATGVVRNSNAELERLGDDRVTLRDRWGEAPVLCEAVAATVTLPLPPDRVRFYPLDERGNRRQAADVTGAAGKTQVSAGPQHRTLWYEIEVRK